MLSGIYSWLAAKNSVRVSECKENNMQELRGSGSLTVRDHKVNPDSLLFGFRVRPCVAFGGTRAAFSHTLESAIGALFKGYKEQS